jgi:hypothetical protein
LIRKHMDSSKMHNDNAIANSCGLKLKRAENGYTYTAKDTTYNIVRDANCFHVYRINGDDEPKIIHRFCETIREAKNEIFLDLELMHSQIVPIKRDGSISESIQSIEDLEQEIKATYKPRRGKNLLHCNNSGSTFSIADQIKLGRLFCLAKPVLYRGFKVWVEKKFGISVRTAQNYMNLYRNAGSSSKSAGAFKNTPFYSKQKINVVYFIQAECGDSYLGPVKIGHAEKFKNRFTVMKVANFHELKILKLIKGDRSKEKEIHQKFAGLRIRGEWFRPDQSLLNYISQLQEPKDCSLLREEVLQIVNIFSEPSVRG